MKYKIGEIMKRPALPTAVVRGLMAALVAATAITVVPPTAAAAQIAAVPVQAAHAADVPEWGETDERDRGRAWSVLGLGEVEPRHLSMSERDFVNEIWKNSGAKGEIHAAAQLTLMENDPAGYVAFIQGGIHDAQARQIANDMMAEAELREARKLRRNAAAAAGLVADESMLLLSEKNFIVEVLLAAKGPRVMAAAEAALRGNAAAQHDFLVSGVQVAAEQDLQDLLDKLEIDEKVEYERLKRLAAMRSAAAVLGIVASDGWLAMTDTNFIVAIWNAAIKDTEVHAAAEKAVRSTDPVAQRAFIDAGIHAANRRDIQIALDIKAKADRELAEKVLAKAEMDGAENLAISARQALHTGPDDVADFLRVGQHQVATDGSNRPGSGSWQWVNAETGKCFGVAGDVQAGAKVTQLSCAADRVQWHAMRVANTGGQYRLVSAVDPTKCVSLPGDGKDAGVQLELRTCGTSAVQTWYHRAAGDAYTWVNAHSDKAIAPATSGPADGAKVLTAEFDDSKVQRWTPQRVTLRLGQQLVHGQSVRSADTRFHLAMQTDGNVVLYRGTAALWNTNTRDGVRLINQPDGNLVLYRADGTAVWSSKTSGNGRSVLRVQDDGTVTLDRTDGRTTWSPSRNAMTVGLRMTKGQAMQSNDLRFTFALQPDGNLVLYKNGAPLWASNTRDGATLQNQDDGNLVLYRADNTPTWSSGTYGKGASTLKLQDDGNVVLYANSGGSSTWSTRTCCH
jgi:hypothetical protein